MQVATHYGMDLPNVSLPSLPDEQREIQHQKKSDAR